MEVQGLTPPQKRYDYQPLAAGVGDANYQVRTIQLFGGRDEPLRCKIDHVDLSAAKYAALSYEWGNPKEYGYIDVIDADHRPRGVLPLTENLYGALCSLRDSPEVEYTTFWIDQLSIDQDSNVERSHQVNQMGLIYKRAERVISYLGPQGPFDNQAFKLLEEVHQQYNSLQDEQRLDINVTKRFQDLDLIPPHLLWKIDVSDPAWQALWKMVHGPWTRRLWMLQETCLNQSGDVLMLRGERVIEWEKLTYIAMLDALGLIPEYANSQSNVHQMQCIVALCCWLIRTSERATLSMLNELLHNFSNKMQCRDDRDRIYGLLGMASDAADLGIVVDYSKTYEEVLLDVSMCMLSAGRVSTPLGHWDDRNLDEELLLRNGKPLPSWVMRWRSNTVSLLGTGMASYGWDGPIEFSDDRSTLMLQGIVVGIVQSNVYLPDITHPINQKGLEAFEKAMATVRAHMTVAPPTKMQALVRRMKRRSKERSTLSKRDIDETITNTMAATNYDYNGTAIDNLLALTAVGKDYFKMDFVDNTYISLESRLIHLPASKQTHIALLMNKIPQYKRCLALVDGHRICQAPMHAEPGDAIALCRSAHALYVLRPVPGQWNTFRFVGDAFMYNYMEGELFKLSGWEKDVRTLKIV